MPIPSAGDAGNRCLASKLAVSSDLAGNARHLRRESVELVDHRVQGIFEEQDLSAHIDSDLLGQVSLGNRRRHLGDVADLARQIARHRVDAVGQILPSACDAGHDGLAAQSPFGADLARHARHLGRE